MKFLKYTLIAIFSIIIAKWLITLLPSSYTEKDSFKVNKTEESKEIKVDISFRHLERPINDELKKAQKDIDKFTDQKINEFNEVAIANYLKKEYPIKSLNEYFFINDENTVKTHHEKIMIAQVREYDFNEVEHQIAELLKFANVYKNYMVVSKMKELVPEYISQNSQYERLDMEMKK